MSIIPNPLVNPILTVRQQLSVFDTEDQKDLADSIDDGSFNLKEAVKKSEKSSDIEVRDFEFEMVEADYSAEFIIEIQTNNRIISLSPKLSDGYKDYDIFLDNICDEFSAVMPEYKSRHVTRDDCPLGHFSFQSIPKGVIKDERNTVQTHIVVDFIMDDSLSRSDIETINQKVNEQGQAAFQTMIGRVMDETLKDSKAVSSTVKSDNTIRVTINDSSVGSIGLGKLRSLMDSKDYPKDFIDYMLIRAVKK